MPIIHQLWGNFADLLSSYYEADCQGTSVVHLRGISLCGFIPHEFLHKRHILLYDRCTELAQVIEMI